MNVRITAFNCENLFGRYRFLDKPGSVPGIDYNTDLQIYEVVAFNPGRKGTLKPQPIAEVQRKTTGAAILEAQPDILAVEEVENLATLRVFNARYCGNYFDRIILMDGNDPRGIDVGLLVRKGFKAEVQNARSNADLAGAGGFLKKTNRADMAVVGAAAFSRDCLEVDVTVNGKPLTFLINHLKAQDGKPASVKRRRAQAEVVAKIVKRVRAAGRLPVVLGDLNMDVDGTKYDQSLDPIYTLPGLHDPFATRPDRWTHFYSSKKSVSRLDYLLVDQSLKAAVTGTDIFRGGLSSKCKQFTGARLPSMAGNDLEASDHCPVSVDLKL